MKGVKVSDIPPAVLGPHSMDGIRERAPAMGVKDSDNPTLLSDLVGRQKQAPAKGALNSEILTQFSDSTRVGW